MKQIRKNGKTVTAIHADGVYHITKQTATFTARIKCLCPNAANYYFNELKKDILK